MSKYSVTPVDEEIYFGNHIDILKEKENIAELKSKLSTFTYLYHQGRKSLDKHAIVSTTDVHGKIIHANRKFIDISGYSSDELIGSTHSIVNSGEHDEEFFKNFYKTIYSGKTWNGELKNKKKNGNFYWVNATVEPTFGPDGIHNGFIAIRTDITKEKEQLFKAEQENLAKDKFLSTISHELRTPLNAIMGYSQLLKNEKLTAKQQDYVETILSSSNHLTSNIDQLVSFEENIEVKEGYCNLKETIETLLANLRLEIESEKILVTHDFSQDYSVKLSQDNVMTIFNNLIGNSIKYNHYEGSIKIQYIENKEDFIDISITNTGFGIAEENISSIFQRFNRGKHTNGAIPGNGLGLAIVEELIAKTGGSIECESDGATWAKFTVKLPLKDEK